MKRSQLVFLSALSLLSHTVQAEVYKWINDQGQVEYSDQYREGAETVQIAPLSTIQMPKLTDVPTTAEQPAEPEATLYKKLAITFPQPEASFHSGNGDVSVTVEVAPELLPSHSLRLSLDGESVTVGRAKTFSLPNVERGTHQLSLDVVDSTSVIQSASPVSFTIHRPSALKKPIHPTPKAP